MICPICGSAELVPDFHKKLPFHWRGETTMINCMGDGCPVCGEVLLNEAGDKMVEEQIRAFKDKIAAAYPGYIYSVRYKLGLTQKQAGELFGGGANAFSRYELGKCIPPLSLVQLFRILEHHPELISEI